MSHIIINHASGIADDRNNKLIKSLLCNIPSGSRQSIDLRLTEDEAIKYFSGSYIAILRKGSIIIDGNILEVGQHDNNQENSEEEVILSTIKRVFNGKLPTISDFDIIYDECNIVGGIF